MLKSARNRRNELFAYIKDNAGLATLQRYDSWLKDHYPGELMKAGLAE